MQNGRLIALAAFNGLVATALAAVGAHALPTDVGESGRALFAQATEFHLFHALAMLGAGVIANSVWAGRAGLLFQLGILGFSASLYWRALMGAGSLGAFHWVTPTGGMLLMAGWVCLIVAGLKAARS